MDRILTDKELEKLNSTDGIIEMLCGIPNFKSEMYNQLDEDKQDLIDYTMSIDLISNRQIERNLRRSLDSENIALLEKRKLIALSLLYFGKKDDTGKYVTYTCPYTGKEYNISEIERELEKKRSEKDSNKRLELEHIMPHSGGGGTVLFNCLLSSVEANGIGEKWNFHLLDWFNQSGKKYYTPDRLNRIVCYMLSAYSVAYKEYKDNELEFNYVFVDGEKEYTDNDELETISKEKIKQRKIKLTKIDEYKTYLDDLVKKLKADNYDTTAIDIKIKELEKQGIFKTNKKYELVQRIVEGIFQEESNDTSYLTNSLKVDYYRLVDSIEFEQEEDIRKEVMARIDIIKSILKENNKGMKDYYISMKDLQDIDLLYIPMSKLNDENKKIFEENIKLSVDTKINIFIDMLEDEKYTSYKNGNPDNNNIFKSSNRIKFEGYRDISELYINNFWNNYSSKIKERLEQRLDELNSKENKTEEEQDKLIKLKEAQTAIKNYEFANKFNLLGKIDVFIDMLGEEEYTKYENGNPDNNNIFKEKNNIHFKEYENISGLYINNFWRSNSPKIKERLEQRFDELNNKENRTEEEQNKLNRLIKAQTAIKNYEFANKSNLVGKIDVFIDMLGEDKYTKYKKGQPDDNNILGRDNKIKFEGYKGIDGLDTSGFWSNNSSEIKDRIEEQIKELNKKQNITKEEQEKFKRLEKVQTAIKNYEFKNSSEAKIDVFIDMLGEDEYTSYEDGKPNSKNIFEQNNKIKFEGYKGIDGLDTSYFWHNYSQKIKERIEQRFDELNSKENKTEKEQNKLNRLIKAQKAIENYEFKNSLEAKIDVFIDMISEKKYTSYKNGELDNNNIFGQNNKNLFKGYENIDGLYINNFWNNQSLKIKNRLEQRLDEFSKKENKTKEEQSKLIKLKEAQKAIKNYEFKNSLEKKIDVFIDMLGEEEYTKYENGDPDNNNIFKDRNKISFKGYEDIEGLDTSYFWHNYSQKIKERIEQRFDELNSKQNKTQEEQEKFDRLKKAKIAIKNYEFANKFNLVGKIDVFIDMLGEEEYTKYKNGKPDSNNIFKTENEIFFKEYEDIEGLYIKELWFKHSPKIKNRLEQRLDKLSKKENRTKVEQNKLDRLEKAKIAIKNYEFSVRSNLVGKIDVFIDMLGKEEYTKYENGKPDNNNIFGRNNEISFEEYEDIDGLNTSGYWSMYCNTHIVPLLFYNQYYDADEKKFVQSDKDYSGEEYDIARTKVLNHLKVKSIDQYIDKLKAKNKKIDKVQNLINLVQILRDKKERLTEYKDGLLEENTNLKQEIMNNMVVTSYGR